MTKQRPTGLKGWRLARESTTEGAESIRYTTLDPKYPYFVAGKGEMNITIENLAKKVKAFKDAYKHGERGGFHWFVRTANQMKKYWMVHIKGGKSGETIEFFRTKKDATTFAKDWMKMHPTSPAHPAKPPKRNATPKPKKAAAKKPVKKPEPGMSTTQRKRLNATGRITVKRGGKFVTITR